MDAVKEFEAVLQQDPRLVSVRLNLGLALMQLGKVPEATQEFQEVLRLDPTNQAARGLLAQSERYKQ